MSCDAEDYVVTLSYIITMFRLGFLDAKDPGLMRPEEWQVYCDRVRKTAAL